MPNEVLQILVTSAHLMAPGVVAEAAEVAAAK